MKFESSARGWCFMTYPYNGGAGKDPATCWNAEVTRHHGRWIADARALYLAATHLRIQLHLQVPRQESPGP